MNRFDKFCNQILQENYTPTAREVLYRRYGKDVADSMIAKIKARGRDSYLEKKYVLPDYSEKNLDRVIPVIFKDFEKMIPANGAAAYGIPTGIPFIKPHIGVNTRTHRAIKPFLQELETGSVDYVSDFPNDLVGHETTHTLQRGLHLNPKNMFEYPLQYEFAPVLGEIKRRYYRETGILLDADATDAQINQFINYCKEHNIFKQNSYGGQIDFEKLLRTSEGKEVFRRIVKQTPLKSNTVVA